MPFSGLTLFLLRSLLDLEHPSRGCGLYRGVRYFLTLFFRVTGWGFIARLFFCRRNNRVKSRRNMSIFVRNALIISELCVFGWRFDRHIFFFRAAIVLSVDRGMRPYAVKLAFLLPEMFYIHIVLTIHAYIALKAFPRSQTA